MVESDSNKKKRPEPERASFVVKPKKKLSKALLVIPAVLIVLAIISVSVYFDNNKIAVRHIVVEDSSVPADFDGFKILQISDFHGCTFGENNSELVSLVESLEYDIIILTGDYLDAGKNIEDIEPVCAFLNALGGSKPVYYILGENDYEPLEDSTSEGWNMCIVPEENNDVMDRLEACGAIFVYPIQEITKGSSRIFLTGIKYQEKLFDTYNFDSDKDFSICVTHKPINYDVDDRLSAINSNAFKEVDFDLTISGHTLGGQYRLPLLGTIYQKGSGLFPQEEYSYGYHIIEERHSYITSGLGQERGFRLCNTPEIVIIELKCGE